jgi:crotonobetainyl-CoA:carnitine CoA-transferase CaiB-like acyl-CoA transferase
MDPIPAVGQHTDAILRELGYDAGAIAKLRNESVI